MFLSLLFLGYSAISRSSSATALQQVQPSRTGYSLNREHIEQWCLHPFDSNSKDVSVEMCWTEAIALEISKQSLVRILVRLIKRMVAYTCGMFSDH